MIMKKIVWMLVASALVSCGSDDTAAIYTAGSVTPAITTIAGTDFFEIPATVRDTVLVVESNIWWKIGGETPAGEKQEWFGYEVRGNRIGRTEIACTLEENLTKEDRHTELLLVADGDSDYSKTLTFVHKCSEPFAYCGNLDDYYDPQREAVVMPAYSETVTLLITSNASWSAESSDPEWLSLEEGSGWGTGKDAALVVTGHSNVSGATRTATLTLRNDDDPDEVLLTIKFFQAADFPAPVLTVVNDAEKLCAEWIPADGARGYGVLLYDDEGEQLLYTELATTATTFDMTDFAVATGLTGYVGPLRIRIRALTPDPNFYTESEEVSSHSHFATGKGTAEDRFRIANPRQLLNLAPVCAIGYYYYLLDTDLDLDGAAYPVFSSKVAPFVGDFDGGDRTVSNMVRTVSLTETSLTEYALFNSVANRGGQISRVANLRFSECRIEGPLSGITSGRSFAHCVALNNGGVIENIRTENCIVGFVSGNPVNTSGTTLYYAQIVGQNLPGDGTGGQVRGCTTVGGYVGYKTRPDFHPQNHANNFHVAGIAGFNQRGGVVESCENVSTSVGGYSTAAGIVGQNNGTIRRCVNRAPVCGVFRIGGICGYATANSDFLMEYCSNSGLISYLQAKNACSMGGCVGAIDVDAEFTLRNCCNTGTVTLQTDFTNDTGLSNRAIAVGGLIGKAGVNATKFRLTMADCYNRGVVKMEIANGGGAANFNGQRAGGLIGWFNCNKTIIGTLKSSYSAAAVSVTTGGVKAANVEPLIGQKQNGEGLPYSGVYFLEGVTSSNGDVMPAKWGGVSCTDAQMRDAATFTAFDFNSVWEMASDGYPGLQDMPDTE